MPREDRNRRKRRKLGFLISLLLISALTVLAANIFADIITENDVKLKTNSELTYYLTVQEDGTDVDGVESSDTQMANLTSGRINVTDRIPDGLVFQGFVTTPNGKISATSRADSSISCSGVVVDDTNEATVDDGTWNNDNTKFYYHGLHYDVATRTVSFKVEKLKAGCEISVGIITKTPSAVDDPGTAAVETRRDFYNNALASEKDLTAISNTVHGYIESQETITYPVTYSYTGDVPAGAPDAPSAQSYAANSDVAVATSPTLAGYTFSGWTTTDATVTDDSFTMPQQAVHFVGIWVQDVAPSTHSVAYVIDGEMPPEYLIPAPRSYAVDSEVSLEDLQPGDVVDGYRFLGWTSSDVTISGSGFTMPDNDVEIVGRFERISYTVCYEFEGTILPPSASTLLPACATHYPGDTVTTANKPSATGYEFVGWYKNDTFTMPEKNVVILGEWTLAAPGKFAPTIAKIITNPKDEYVYGETVEFKVTVTNTATFAIKDVYVSELLEGAVIDESPNNSYSIIGNTTASIPSIAAGASVDIFAHYQVTQNKNQTITNTARITGARADNNYVIDQGESYMASAQFTTVAEPAPFTGIIFNPFTYIGMIILALVILFATKIAPKIDWRPVGRALHQADFVVDYLKKTSMPTRVLYGVLALSLVVGSVAMRNAVAEEHTEVIGSISFSSEHTSYEDREGGSWNVIKSAEWINNTTARITFEVDTVAKIRDNAGLDVILVVDTSGSMQGEKIDKVKNDALGLAEEVVNNYNGRVSVINFGTDATIQSELTDDLDALDSAIDNLTAGGETNYNAGLIKAGEVLEGYQTQPGRKLTLLFLTDGYPNLDTPNQEATYRILKANYPDMLVSGIQYEVNNEILEPIVYVSDQQFIADMGNLNNVLVNSLYESVAFSDFVLTDYIDGDFWEVTGSSSIDASAGDFELVNENGVQSIVWDLSSQFWSGASAEMTIDIQLKDNIEYTENSYLPTNTHETVDSKLVDMPSENVVSTETPVLKARYNVTYDANLPSRCSSYNGTIPADGSYTPLSVVLVPADAISCDDYNFMGWQDTNGSYGLLNGNYIRLKNSDVALKAIWSKVSIKKSMDGTIHGGSVAQLDAGPNVNVALKRLVDPSVSSYDDNVDSLLAIKTASSMSAQQEANAVLISSTESEHPIYAWFDDSDGTVYIYTEAGTIMGNPDMSRLFQGIRGLTDASAVVDWDMSETVNLDAALSLTGFLDLDDFANWDVSKVESMEMLLYVGWQLTDISGLANWNVGNVTNMWGTFNGVERISDLSPLANWDVSKVVDMGYMFNGNMAIENLDGLENWDVSQVQDMSNMFNGATNLSDISGLANWKTDSLRGMSFMFNGTAITNVDALEDWNVENVETMYCLFRLAKNLTDISGLTNWDTGNVVDMGGMFHSTSITSTSPLANWNTESAHSFSQMFFGTNITNIDGLANWETGNVESMEYMFGYTDDLTDISGASGWDTSNVTDMSQMFRASSITNINALANWNTGNVTNMGSMFQSADKLTDISGASGWNVSKVEYLSYMFADDALITYLKTLDGWDTSSVIEKGDMFQNIPDSIQRPIWWNL